MLILDVRVNFLFSHSLPLPGAYLGKNGPLWPISNTPKKLPKMDPYVPKMAKNANFGLLSRYGRLKLKFLCEHFSFLIVFIAPVQLN